MFGPTLDTRNAAAALRDLRHDKPEVRASAARDLCQVDAAGRAEAVPALVRGLDDPHPMVREAAAVALSSLAPAEALDRLLDVAAEDVPAVRQAALMAVGAIASGRATERVARLLADDAPAIRFQALIAFARSASRDRAVEVLLRATTDDDPLVGHIALRLAEELGDEAGPVAPRILERCAELVLRPEPEPRVAAAVILARAGRRDGIPTLLAVIAGELTTSQGEDVAAAIELAGELGLKKAQPALRRRAFGGVMGFGGDPFAWQARVALARLGDDRARRWILGELRSFSRERRTLGAAAAGRARLTEARALLEAMRGDARRAEPDAVEQALRDLDAPLGV
ncbi:MAG: HEAT repeat domain-containing protein [Deltaproteobacteria bacterium]|nr:HEAT repeat domain-containing protein [Deltaproteobacteria bacterium]